MSAYALRRAALMLGARRLPAAACARAGRRALSMAAKPQELSWADAKKMPSPSAGKKKPGPVKGSDVPRLNIGIFGAMNAGKSLLMNRITRQETSIVDSTPGTTADTKIALLELHDIGPVKLFDTAGVDETGALGEKKRAKTLASLKESDLAVVVIDANALGAGRAQQLSWERELLEAAAHGGVLPLLVVNAKRTQVDAAAVEATRAALCDGLGAKAAEGAAARGAALAYQPSDFADAPALAVDLADEREAIRALTAFLQSNAARVKAFMPRALPERYLRPDAGVFLNIPMDAETPSMRLLRPQALVQEEAIRHWATTVSYRMDLGAARGADADARDKEKARFQRALRAAIEACPPDAPKILITDSQAMDVVHPWTLDESGAPLIDVTTFSIAMMHRMSGARLPLFAEGMRKFMQLAPGDRVLMAEACNHNRITDVCNDIGMVQIPQMIGAQTEGIEIEHAFGREFPALDKGLGSYDLVIHCGACMIDHQKVRARIADALEAGVPITNYGLLMSYAYNGAAALERVLQPWEDSHGAH